jgi:hypothetical protein
LEEISANDESYRRLGSVLQHLSLPNPPENVLFGGPPLNSSQSPPSQLQCSYSFSSEQQELLRLEIVNVSNRVVEDEFILVERCISLFDHPY